jgi:hypothetical protein
VLSLSENEARDLGAWHLATAISSGALPCLQTLLLDRNFIGEAGARALGPGLQVSERR